MRVNDLFNSNSSIIYAWFLCDLLCIVRRHQNARHDSMRFRIVVIVIGQGLDAEGIRGMLE